MTSANHITVGDMTSLGNHSYPYDDTTQSATFYSDTSPIALTNTTLLDLVGNITTDDDIVNEQNLAQVIGISIVVGFISIITMAGNLLVIIAFKIDKQLQTISNCFLLSLAVADFTIGLVSMPLYTVYLLMGYWPLGPALCDLWLSLDYTMSNASVANLLIICFDRYFSVTRPLTYRAHRTPKKAGIMIGCAWAVSVLLWTPWIISWPYIEGKRTVPDTECYIQFLTTNAFLTIATALAAFYIPVSVMTILYFKIYKETEKRQKRIPMLQAYAKISMKNKRYRNCSVSNMRPSSISGNGDLSMDEDEELRELSLRRSKEVRGRCSTLCCFNKILDRDYEPTDNSSTSDSPTSPSIKTPRIKHALESFDQEDDSFIRPRRNNTEQSLKRNSVDSNPSVSLTKRPEIRPDNNVIVSDPLLTEDMTYTILIKLPSEIENASPKKPSIKLLYTNSENANSTDNEVAEDQKEELSNSDSEVAQLYTSASRNKSNQDINVYDDDDYQTDDETTSVNKRALNDSSVPPRCGTPALGRRAKSADAAKAANEAHIACKVVNKMENQRVRRKRQERRQERKAAKTLSAILLAFIITWTPYNIFAVVGSFCLTCIHPTVYAFGKYIMCFMNLITLIFYATFFTVSLFSTFCNLILIRKT